MPAAWPVACAVAGRSTFVTNKSSSCLVANGYRLCCIWANTQTGGNIQAGLPPSRIYLCETAQAYVPI
jgi:hypothetical protein